MGEEIAFENDRISNFQGLVTLILDRVILHTVMHQSSTSTYIPNFIESEETYCGRTYWRTFETHFIRSTWRSRPNNKQMVDKRTHRRAVIENWMIPLTAAETPNAFPWAKQPPKLSISVKGSWPIWYMVPRAHKSQPPNDILISQVSTTSKQCMLFSLIINCILTYNKIRSPQKHWSMKNEKWPLSVWLMLQHSNSSWCEVSREFRATALHGKSVQVPSLLRFNPHQH